MIKINNFAIEKVNKVKFLGVILDDLLSWKHHLDLVASKAAKAVGILYKLRPYLSQKSLIGLYYTFLYPYFTYCNEIWGNACKTYLNRLIMIQKRAIRLICYKSKYAPTNKIFKE